MTVLHNLHTIDINPGDVGVTVRLGRKWADRVGPGDFVRLCVCTDRCQNPDGCGDYVDSCSNCKVVGKAEVSEMWYGEFRRIPARLIEQEHEKRARIYTGLVASMVNAYGDAFTESRDVTGLTYVRVS